MHKNYFEVEVLVNGKPVKEYLKDGKNYIEGREGTRYSVRIKNNSKDRIVAVPSVDGISVINGKVADYKSSGYIIEAYSSVIIDGWRQSNNEIAEFYFSNMADSYAEAVKGKNQGVIGIAIFKEKIDATRDLLNRIKELEDKNKDPKYVPYPVYPYVPRYPVTPINPYVPETTPGPYWGGDIYYCSLNDDGTVNAINDSANEKFTLCSNEVERNSKSCLCASGIAPSGMSQEVGTGWGNTKRSECTEIEFKKDDYPCSVFELYYNTREELIKIGIDFNKRPTYIAPSAFPNQYCKPPKR